MKTKKNIFRKSSIKKPLIIWICVFIVITIIILFLGKNNFFRSEPVEVELDIPQETTPPPDIPSSVYDPGTDIVKEEDIVIDYDSIPGLTQGNKYSKQLVNEGSKNILFVGTDKVSGLYDTIGIMSIDKSDKKVKIIMIPRDLYVNYNLKVRHYIEKKVAEFKGYVNINEYYKINSAHTIGTYMNYEGKFGKNYSMNFLADVIKEKFNIEVSDFMRVNTEGLVQMVDLFGGVYINVPYKMDYDDPFQDLSIHLEKGYQLLDGKKAEGFVRFRQGYNEEGELVKYGDYERKKNQTAFMKAFIEQHGTISNVNKIPGMINVLNKNLKHSIGVGDILTSYIGLAKDVVVDKYSIESITVTGKDKKLNGLYYIVIDDDI